MNVRFSAERKTATGRSEPVDFDVATSGKGSTAAVGRAQFYAGTRPIAVCHAVDKRTFATPADLAIAYLDS